MRISPLSLYSYTLAGVEHVEPIRHLSDGNQTLSKPESGVAEFGFQPIRIELVLHSDWPQTELLLVRILLK